MRRSMINFSPPESREECLHASMAGICGVLKPKRQSLKTLKDIRMKTIIIVFGVVIFLVSCKKDPVGQTPIDATAPGKVSNVEVQNTAGGAVITYKIPSDKDLAYIRAEYLRNGLKATDHSSSYNNSLEVEGFSTTDPVVVRLFSVDFSNNHSEPVEVTIHPLQAYIHTVFNTLEFLRDIGGVNMKWDNVQKKPISVTVLFSTDGVNYAENERYFSEELTGDHKFGGLQDMLTNFKVFVQDKWGNSSDTLFFQLTPFYSAPLNRRIITQVKLPFDCTSQYPHGQWANCLDGDTFDSGWITLYDNNPENDFNFPVATTFDLRDTAYLLTTKLWMRGLLEYGIGAFKDVEFWGTMEIPGNKPRDYWAFDERGSWKNDWVFLGKFSTTKASGPTGPVTEQDKIWARENGFEFRFEAAPQVRYVRMLVNSTWSGAKVIELCEIAFSGDAR